METNFEKKYHSLEKNHWWFVSRREMVLSLMRKIKKDSLILDVGCSGGELLYDLEKSGFVNLSGTDISQDAITLAKKRKSISNFFVGDAQNLKINKKFDVIIASDVLEHLSDENKAITSWKNHLKPQGKIICFVPAFKFLWSNHDILNKHFKRYTLQNLSHLFISNGFFLEKSSFWNFFLFFPTLLLRLFFKNPKFSKNQLNLPNPVLNWFLIKILSFENKILKTKNFPFGVSVFVVARNSY